MIDTTDTKQPRQSLARIGALVCVVGFAGALAACNNEPAQNDGTPSPTASIAPSTAPAGGTDGATRTQ